MDFLAGDLVCPKLTANKTRNYLHEIISLYIDGGILKARVRSLSDSTEHTVFMSYMEPYWIQKNDRIQVDCFQYIILDIQQTAYGVVEVQAKNIIDGGIESFNDDKIFKHFTIFL